MSYRQERKGSSDSRHSTRVERRGISDSRSSAHVEQRRGSSSSSGSRRGTQESGERRSSAGSSSSLPKPRDENELPAAFGRVPTSPEETDLDVLQRMSKSFINTPLGDLTSCIDGERKIKIWTRDFSKVHGICVGYLIAFDKHWNLVLSDVEEAYWKPKKNKTPFLDDMESAREFQELAPKVSRPKKKPEEKQQEQVEEQEKPETGEKETKKKRKKKKKSTLHKRVLKQLFVRGDNIVMLTILPKDE